MATLHGKVVAGRGVGSEHISRASDELRIITGERPYPGTLNILLDRPAKLREEAGKPFDGGERLLWRARLNGTPVWLYRWRHAPLHVLEVVAPFSLRERFGIEYNSPAAIELDEGCLGHVPWFGWALLWKGRERFVYTNHRYHQLVSNVMRMTGFGIDPTGAAIKKTLRGILRKTGLDKSQRPYRFCRVDIDTDDSVAREFKQVFNLLNYTKTSNTDYSAQKYPAGYHSIDLNDQRLSGQRDPRARLAQVPIDFAGKSVLDLGSNQGGMLLQLADRLKWGVGVDFDHRMVNAANRIKSAKGASPLNFYVFDLQKEDLQIIRDFLPEQRADVCFLLSVCMWLTNWRTVIEFAASIADSVLFESNGTPEQQRDQIEYLGNLLPNVTFLSGESSDDTGQSNRKLLLARR
ncbi:methyltransferase domain-containing protein [Sphingomonas segetis]|jgi:SAM-dependent methyltransferase|uniref:methyltransferase domain-containing protein n=1 Tax=Sphingomonas segetis TaxID=1104779 RepID=UPI0012D2DB3D|nr:methyltransferase domain-containing protein [Sphingomonas segetis]